MALCGTLPPVQVRLTKPNLKALKKIAGSRSKEGIQISLTQLANWYLWQELRKHLDSDGK